MEPRTRTYGFTLAELAVAMAIVGLLLGAVIAAKRLQENSAILATVSDVSSYGAATAAFVDRYGALPGDLRAAADKIPGCETRLGCEADREAPTTGDGNVGRPGRITRHQTAGSEPAERETVLFWKHLRLSGLIRGLDGSTSETSPPAWGVTHPAAPVGGGFHAKDADGGVTDPLPGWPPSAPQPTGTYLVLQPEVAGHLVPAQPGSQALTAGQAALIDRKMDNGDPFDGTVVGYGTVTLMFSGAGCFAWSAVDRGRYDEGEEGRDCGLAFRIGP